MSSTMALIAIGALLLQGVVSAEIATDFAPNLFFNWTWNIADSALMFGPKPFAIPSTGTWNVTADESPDRRQAVSRFNNGSNDPFPASIDVLFTGTAAWIYGEGTSQFEVLLDDQRLTIRRWAEGNLLAAVTDATMGSHVMTLRAISQPWRVNNVTTTLGIVSDAESLDKMNVRTEPFAFARDGQSEGIRNEFYNYTGSWNSLSGNSMSGDVGASIAVDVPANTSFLVVNGYANSIGGIGEVTYKPDLPLEGMSKFTSYLPGIGVASNATLHYAVLDPRVQYTMHIDLQTALEAKTEGNEPSAALLSVSSDKSDGSVPGDQSSSTSANAGEATAASNSKNDGKIATSGQVAGAVVGGVLGGAAIMGAIAALVWRRHGRRPLQARTLGSDDEFIVDEEPKPTATEVAPAAVTYHPHPGKVLPSPGASSDSDRRRVSHGSREMKSRHGNHIAPHALGTQGLVAAKLGDMGSEGSSVDGDESSSGYPLSGSEKQSRGMGGTSSNGHSGAGNRLGVPTRRPLSHGGDGGGSATGVYSQEERSDTLEPADDDDEHELIPPSYNPEWSAAWENAGGDLAEESGPPGAPPLSSAQPHPKEDTQWHQTHTQ